MQTDQNLTLSIIIPTKDRFNDMEKCLEGIVSQTETPETIIIVDASEKSGLEQIIETKLKNHSIETIYIRSKPGLTYQRNLGIQSNNNDLVLFVDDDVVLEKEYIKEMKKLFNDDRQKQIGGATGKILNTKRINTVSQIMRTLFCLSKEGKGEVRKSGANNSISPTIQEQIPIQWLSGCNQIYRKEVFLTNRFDEKLSDYCYMEDVDFSMRVFKETALRYNPDAKCSHFHHSARKSRLTIKEKQKMYMLNYHYLFQKNFHQTFSNTFCHYWSYIGIIITGVFFQRSIQFITGTLQGWYLICRGTNR